jgi:glutaredoxin
MDGFEKRCPVMTVSTDTITVYTTPTCPWCHRAKEFLRKRGVEFQEIDVSDIDRRPRISSVGQVKWACR